MYKDFQYGKNAKTQTLHKLNDNKVVLAKILIQNDFIPLQNFQEFWF